MFLGTSLTEGLGLTDPGREAWPARIQAMADSAGIPINVVNAGLSGETSAGALRRTSWILQTPAELIVVETGANDGLRGLPLDALEANLDSILAEIERRAPEATVVLVGMEALPNMGENYADGFRAVYPRVAARWGAHLLPFRLFLGEVAGTAEFNQDDGIHPTAEGHLRIAEGSWRFLEPILRGLSEPGGAS